MSDFFYDKARQSFATQDPSIDWDTDNIKVALLTSGYIADQANHQYVSDLGANIVARSGNLTGKTATAGVLDADDVTLSAVSGPQVTQFVIYKDTGDDATSPLITHQDSYTSLPVTPNGGDIKIEWPNDANRIGKL
jgi:hypothetical protein